MAIPFLKTVSWLGIGRRRERASHHAPAVAPGAAPRRGPEPAANDAGLLRLVPAREPAPEPSANAVPAIVSDVPRPAPDFPEPDAAPLSAPERIVPEPGVTTPLTSARQLDSLRQWADAAAKEPDTLEELLRVLVLLEELGRPSSLAAARRINDLLSNDAGRATLSAAAASVLREFPDSNFLIYLRAVGLAKAGDVEAANALVLGAMARVRDALVDADARDRTDLTRTFKQLGKVWRVVDTIARDNVVWSIAEGGRDESGREADGTEAGEADPTADDAEGATPSDGGTEPEGAGEADTDAAAPGSGPTDELVFLEPLIQSRQQDKYLQSCLANFNRATTLQEGLSAIKAMLRTGLRRLPTYHDSYAMARDAYRTVRAEWERLLPVPGADFDTILGEDRGVAAMRQLATVLRIARTLEMAEDVERIEAALLAFARMREGQAALWTIARVLVDGDADKYAGVTAALIKGSPRRPAKTNELQDYFAWAYKAHAFEQADEMFRSLPSASRRSKAMMQYVNILQRTGRFDRASELVKLVSAQLLANARRFCPYTNWQYIKRAEELAFCADTARWYRSVPQPTRPVGVLFVLPRDIHQLRRYPLVVLMQLKKMGWAVVPLVEGLLPNEPTGDPLLDQFNGCMLADIRLNPEIRAKLRPITGFEADLARGRLRWGDMDLSHSLWEEAGINRRRFSVDYTCPALQRVLGRLVKWTELNATVIENVHRVARGRGLRTGFMVLSQYRLPDVVNRLFCEKHGDKNRFFCVHATNGYENYFANFATPVSTRTVIRNMTAHPEMRTAAFPVPSAFEAWYRRRSDGAEMLERVRDVTKVRRSTATQRERPAEATAALERVHAFREGGGKVVCAFGKVVCDLAAPHDGGPAHRNVKEWLNDTINAVRDAEDVLLLVKPHPHELRGEIGTFLTEYFTDLIEVPLPDNVILLGHRWFDIGDLDGIIDLGLLYSGTTAVELGLMGVPAVLCSDYAPIDYPVGHIVPRDRGHYHRLVRFEEKPRVRSDIREKCAAWLHYMAGEEITVPYRYHARPLTNKVVYPPWWFRDEMEAYMRKGDPHVQQLALRVTAGT